MRNLLIVVLSLMLGPSALATFTLSSWSEYFLKPPDTTDKNNIKFFAGITGTDCASGDQTNTAPCNSCATLGNISASDKPTCNTHQIYPSLVFRLVVRSDNAEAFASGNQLFVINTENSNQLTVTQPISTNLKVNTDLEITFTWQSLCNSVGAADCKISFNKKFQVGIGPTASNLVESTYFTVALRYVQSSNLSSFACDPDRYPNATYNSYEGFCAYAVYPGDSKIYLRASLVASGDVVGNLTDASGEATASDESQMKYHAMRVFYSAGANYNMSIGNASSRDISYDGTLRSPYVDGLVNDQQYVFLVASVDQGGNVSYFTDPTQVCDNITEGNGCTGLCDASLQICTSPESYDLSQTAIPREVFGLLDKQKCFISTAAYGSAMAEEVEIFRSFRDQVLIKSDWGLFFVRFYYAYSEPIAHFIASSEFLKLFSRALLWPLLLLASLSLKLGFTKLLLLLGIMFSASAGGLIWFKRRKKRML